MAQADQIRYLILLLLLAGVAVAVAVAVLVHLGDLGEGRLISQTAVPAIPLPLLQARAITVAMVLQP
jgi:hypothetical protein